MTAAPTSPTIYPTSSASSERLARQVSLLRALNQLATNVSRFRDETALINHVAQQLATSFEADHIGVLFVEPSREYGVVVAEYPPSGTIGVRYDLNNNPLMRLVEATPNEPVFINNAQEDPRITEETQAVFKQIGLFALMVIALIIDDEIIGTIGFDIYSSGRTFSEDLKEVAQTMSAQLATGIQNIRLLNEAQRRVEQVQRIVEFGQAAQTALDPQTLLPLFITICTRLVNAERVQIAFYDPRQDDLRLVGQQVDGETSIDLQDAPLVSRYSTYLGRTWESRQPLLISDTQAMPESATMQDVSALRALLVAPIQVGDRTLGAVSVGSTQAGVYTVTDQAAFQQLIAQFGAAYANVEAYASSRRAAEQQALVNTITAYYQRNPEIKDMIAYTLQTLGAALQVRRGQIRLALEPEKMSE